MKKKIFLFYFVLFITALPSVAMEQAGLNATTISETLEGCCGAASPLIGETVYQTWTDMCQCLDSIPHCTDGLFSCCDQGIFQDTSDDEQSFDND